MMVASPNPAGTDAGGVRMLIISLSPIARDPRVARQCRLAIDAGFELTVLGFGDQRDTVSGRFVSFPAPVPGAAHSLGVALRQGPALFSPKLAVWTSQLGATVRAMADAARASQPHLIHANDWPALSIATKLGAPVLYDSHEFASGEHEERLLWRLLFKPYISAIEGASVRQAKRVVTVSDGIADKLQAIYDLPERPTVIRNMPYYSRSEFRPVGETVEVLYQGAYNPDRGLENLIDSVLAWPAGYRLTLRGLGPGDYIATLQRRAEGSGGRNRIRFADPVSPADLVQAATSFDIGIHPIPPNTVQTEFCLPNKFFEYAMAGLCLCVSPAKEMASLVASRGLGAVMQGTRAIDIAEAVSSLTRERIDVAKRASLDAARDLNWDHERHRLLAVWRSLL